MNPVAKIVLDVIYLGLERFGRFYSKYRAFVVDNEDPQGYARLRLVIPGIANNPMDYWAWGCNQFSGVGFGCQIIPPKGSMVWVEFEQGDPNKPIWSHGSFAKNHEIPEELKDPYNFWFKTPDGNFISFNDTKGEILIEHKAGPSIRLDKDGVFIQTDKKIYLTNEEGDEPKEVAALGNKVESILEEHNKSILGAIKNSTSGIKGITGFIQKASLAATPAGMLAVFAAEAGPMIKGIVKDNKSNDDINKSLSAVSKKIPEVKSNRVAIDK